MQNMALVQTGKFRPTCKHRAELWIQVFALRLASFPVAQQIAGTGARSPVRFSTTAFPGGNHHCPQDMSLFCQTLAESCFQWFLFLFCVIGHKNKNKFLQFQQNFVRFGLVGCFLTPYKKVWRKTKVFGESVHAVHFIMLCMESCGYLRATTHLSEFLFLSDGFCSLLNVGKTLVSTVYVFSTRFRKIVDGLCGGNTPSNWLPAEYKLRSGLVGCYTTQKNTRRTADPCIVLAFQIEDKGNSFLAQTKNNRFRRRYLSSSAGHCLELQEKAFPLEIFLKYTAAFSCLVWKACVCNWQFDRTKPLL